MTNLRDDHTWAGEGDCPHCDQAFAVLTQPASPLRIEPLGNFREGQWWVKELDAMASKPGATHDQQRAVAVVHNLLRTVAFLQPE